MRRSGNRSPNLLLCGALAALWVLGGCGTPGRTGPLAWLGPSAVGKKSADEQLAQKKNPLKPDADKPKEGESDDEDGEVRLASATSKGKEKEEGKVAHDAATLRLIEEELKNAPPDEREQIYHDLKGLDPRLVREILRMRRLVQRMGQDAPRQQPPDLQRSGERSFAHADANSEDDVSEPHLPATGVRYVARQETAAGPGQASQLVSAGLGQASPWNHSSPTAAGPGADHRLAHRDGVATPDAGRRDPQAHSAGGPVVAANGGQQFGHSSLPSDEPSAAPSRWGDDLQRLVALAEAETAQMQLGPESSESEKTRYVEKQVFLRMLYLMTGQQERALQAIAGLDAADQEFWQQTFWALANYFDVEAIPDGGDRAAQTVTQLRSAVQRLQENARLELRNVNFAHKISSYGNYERFSRDEFSQGQPVLLYAEVGNFKSEPTSEGQHRTVLQSTIEIYRAGPEGGLVDRITFPPTEDLCRNTRRDYFHSYEFSIPQAQRIALGPHVLKLIVEDRLSRKVATYSLNFTVK